MNPQYPGQYPPGGPYDPQQPGPNGPQQAYQPTQYAQVPEPGQGSGPHGAPPPHSATWPPAQPPGTGQSQQAYSAVPPGQYSPDQFGGHVPPGQYPQNPPPGQYPPGGQFPPPPGQFPPGQYPPGYPVAGPPPKKSRTALILGSVLTVLVLVLATLGIVGWTQGWFDTGKGPVALAAGTLPAGAEGEDFARYGPFSDGDYEKYTKVSGDANTDGEVAGTAPLLYSGTNDTLTCDGGKLAEYVAGDPSRRAAFSESVGVQGDVEKYLLGLTSLVLVHDTWVTVHSYTGSGTASESAVLQAGTPVLVDQYGEPKVRCTGAAGLSAATVGDLELGKVSGAWSWFAADKVVRVTPGATAVTSFTVVNLGGAVTDGSGGSSTQLTIPRGIFKLDLKGTWKANASWNDDPVVTLQNDSAVRFDGTIRYGNSGGSKDCVENFVEQRREGNKVYVKMTSTTPRQLCDDFEATMTVVDQTMTMDVTSGEANALTFTKE